MAKWNIEEYSGSVLSIDLINGVVVRLDWNTADYRTACRKQVEGDCGHECHFHPTYGWAPEAGCPVHDPGG